MLHEPRAGAALCRALAGVDRLVLLGDALELRHGPLHEALAAAAPVLAAIGAALGDREVVIVPGNHDHGLLAPWLERRRVSGPAPDLGLEREVDWRPGEALHEVAASLGPARVRVCYPGVWLRADVYALHGHFGDLHTTVPMFERLGAGAMSRLAARPRLTGADDYEAVLGPMYGFIDGLAEQRAPAPGRRSTHAPSARAWRALEGDGAPRGLRRRALRAAVAAGVGTLNRAGLGPLRADLSGAALRRAGLAACAQVVAGLGVTAPYVIFGHTHRAGPLPGDDPGEWRARGGASALVNTGSWVHEPEHLGPSPATSPYRPGFAVVVGTAGPPQLVNLLD